MENTVGVELEDIERLVRGEIGIGGWRLMGRGRRRGWMC